MSQTPTLHIQNKRLSPVYCALPPPPPSLAHRSTFSQLLIPLTPHDSIIPPPLPCGYRLHVVSPLHWSDSGKTDRIGLTKKNRYDGDIDDDTTRYTSDSGLPGALGSFSEPVSATSWPMLPCRSRARPG
ncbi:unnamed protein product [Discosporangium mesarthrocarpum]